MSYNKSVQIIILIVYVFVFAACVIIEMCLNIDEWVWSAVVKKRFVFYKLIYFVF